MGLFDKKYCDFCGEKIGLLGNRKLEDGNMCKKCARQISPWLTGRKGYTVDEMKEHLAYREENKARVEAFNATRTLGLETKVYLDEDKGQFLVSRSRNYRNENPDVLEFSQITGCNVIIDEAQHEIYREGPDGENESYDPPRYKKTYDFKVVLEVNSPWFSVMDIMVESDDVERYSAEYQQAEKVCEEIKEALTSIRSEARAAAAEASKPRTAVQCPYCGATTVPDAGGKCEYCGGAIG